MNKIIQPALSGFEHINRYWDNSKKSVIAKISPGQYYVTLHNEIISTVLGSCISACIRDKTKHLGGINHFMLPIKGCIHRDKDNSALLNVAARYGNWAMELLINEILKRGGTRRNLEVKIFGGSKILSGFTEIGEENIRFIQKYLHDENLIPCAQDVGGDAPRLVHYNPTNGKVMVMNLNSSSSRRICEEEKGYFDNIQNTNVSGSAELF